jgi:integrase
MTTQISVRIVRRGIDSWRLTTRLGRDDAGKWIEKSETVRGNAAAAEKRKAEILVGGARPPVAQDRPERAARLVDYALASARRALTEGRIRRTSYENYASLIATTADLLGDHTLHSFDRRAAKAFMQQLRDREPAFSVGTLYQIKATYSRAFTEAVADEILDVNPFVGMKMPARTTSKGRAISHVDELQRLREICQTEFYGLLVRWQLGTGMRRGETVALVWRDIDIERGRVHVSRAAATTKGGVVIGAPKTRRAVRSLGIPPALLPDMRAAFTRAALRAKSTGETLLDLPVFTNHLGERLRPASMTGVVREVLKKAGLGSHRQHDLRHTHATHLLREQPIGVVSRRLGHSSANITLNVYDHALPNDDADATIAADGLL